MDVTFLDPRDAYELRGPRTAQWQDESPRYRVLLWEHRGPGAWVAAEYEIADAADVTEVVAWARARQPDGGLFGVWVVAEHCHLGVVLVAGAQPDLGGAPDGLFYD